MRKFKFMFLMFFAVTFVSCIAQTYPLNTFYDNVPNNSYLKDINNELSPFVGTYTAKFDDKEITLYIDLNIKELTNKVDKIFYRDNLDAKLIIKNNSGQVLLNTKDYSAGLDELKSFGTDLEKTIVYFYYSGTKCRVGWGKVTLEKISNNQILWNYYPNSIILTDKTCPDGSNIKLYLPQVKDLIFTKF